MELEFSEVHIQDPAYLHPDTPRITHSRRPAQPGPLELVTPVDRYARLWMFSRREQMFVVTDFQLLDNPFLAPFRGCGWGYAELRHNGVLRSSPIENSQTFATRKQRPSNRKDSSFE